VPRVSIRGALGEPFFFYAEESQRLIFVQPLSEPARLALDRLSQLKENVDSIALDDEKGVSAFPRPAVPAMGMPIPNAGYIV
jgi:hypothetical protein